MRRIKIDWLVVSACVLCTALLLLSCRQEKSSPSLEVHNFLKGELNLPAEINGTSPNLVEQIIYAVYRNERFEILSGWTGTEFNTIDIDTISEAAPVICYLDVSANWDVLCQLHASLSSKEINTLYIAYENKYGDDSISGGYLRLMFAKNKGSTKALKLHLQADGSVIRATEKEDCIYSSADKEKLLDECLAWVSQHEDSVIVLLGDSGVVAGDIIKLYSDINQVCRRRVYLQRAQLPATQ